MPEHAPLTVARVTVATLRWAAGGGRSPLDGKRCWAVKHPEIAGDSPAARASRGWWSVYDPDDGTGYGYGEASLRDVAVLRVLTDVSEPTWVRSLPNEEPGAWAN